MIFETIDSFMWQAVDQEFSLNYKLLQLYILEVILPDSSIPSLSDHRVTVCCIMSIIMIVDCTCTCEISC